MKKTILVAALLTVGGSMMAQTTDDPVIMRVNGVPVTRSEFEYSFNKNNADGVLDKKGVEDYVPLFVDFKLKVAEAKALGKTRCRQSAPNWRATRSRWCFRHWSIRTLSNVRH